MRKPNPNSLRQKLISLPVGDKMEIKRGTGEGEIKKPGSLGSLLYSIKRDEKQAYTYETLETTVIVRRTS